MALKASMAHRHCMETHLSVKQMMSSDVCSWVLAMALDAYPATGDPYYDMLADTAKTQLAQVWQHEPKYVCEWPLDVDDDDEDDAKSS